MTWVNWNDKITPCTAGGLSMYPESCTDTYESRARAVPAADGFFRAACRLWRHGMPLMAARHAAYGGTACRNTRNGQPPRGSSCMARQPPRAAKTPGCPQRAAGRRSGPVPALVPAACTGTASRRDAGLGDGVDLNLPVFACFCKHCSRHCALQKPLLHGSPAQPACPSRQLTGFVTGVRGGVEIEVCPSRVETGVGSRPGPFRALLTWRTAGQSCG